MMSNKLKHSNFNKYGNLTHKRRILEKQIQIIKHDNCCKCKNHVETKNIITH